MPKKKTVRKKRKKKKEKEVFAHAVKLSKAEMLIGRTKYKFWPKAIGMEECDALDIEAQKFVDEGQLGPASEVALKQIRIWIPELKDSDALMYSVTQLACLKIILYSIALRHDKGETQHKVIPKEFKIKIGRRAWDYYPSGLLLAEWPKMDDKYGDGAATSVRLNIEQIQLFIPDLTDGDFDQYSLVQIQAIRNEIMSNALNYTRPSIKKGLAAVARANAKTATKTPKKTAARKRKAKRG